MKLSVKDRELIKTFKNIRRNLKKKKCVCMVEDCECEAINSHLLQRHRILNKIIEDGHLMELSINDMFRWTPNESPIKFERVGLNDAISYPLFCNRHDAQLFVDIEIDEPELNDYRNQLLFSYRAFCSEEYKKKFEAEFITRLVSSQTLSIDTQILTQLRKGYQLGEKDLIQMRRVILTELEEPSRQFEFVHLKYPFFPIYASSPFSFETNVNKLFSSELWTGAVIHIIPLNDNLHVVIGYLKETLNNDLFKYIDKWRCADKEALGLLLTDLFVHRIENFGMSPALYRSLNKDSIQKFYKEQLTNHGIYNMNCFVDFNMFAGEMWDAYPYFSQSL